MTVQYNGNDEYKIWVDFNVITLSSKEVREIQSFNFDTCKATDTVSDLNSKICSLEVDLMDSEDLVTELQSDIEDLEEDNSNLKDYIKLLKDKNND